jgi:hypothetical protein
MPNSMTIKPGDLVTLPERDQAWLVVYIDDERGFARLERAGEAWVKSKVCDLDTLQAYIEISEELREATVN